MKQGSLCLYWCSHISRKLKLFYQSIHLNPNFKYQFRICTHFETPFVILKMCSLQSYLFNKLVWNWVTLSACKCESLVLNRTIIVVQCTGISANCARINLSFIQMNKCCSANLSVCIRISISHNYLRICNLMRSIVIYVLCWLCELERWI